MPGPKSPLGGRVGICGAYSSKHERIILTGLRGKRDGNSVYSFDPVSKEFEELPGLPEKKKRMSCGIVGDGDLFVVAGGFK